MEKDLESKAYKLCEQLPLDNTLFEKRGLCTVNSAKCDYSHPCNANVSKRKIIYSCNKKTYIFKPKLQYI